MAEVTYIIYNKTGYNIGFRRPNGLEVNLAPGRLITLSELDILYEAPCMTKWLKDGAFHCDDVRLYEMLGIDRGAAIVSLTDADVIEKFKAPMRAFTAWLDSLDGEAVLERVFAAACKYDDLPVKKLEMIEKKSGKSIATYRKATELGKHEVSA